MSTSVLQAGDASLSNLNVSGTAHFFQLMIDQIKSSRGQTIVTAANAKIYKVEKIMMITSVSSMLPMMSLKLVTCLQSMT